MKIKMMRVTLVPRLEMAGRWWARRDRQGAGEIFHVGSDWPARRWGAGHRGWAGWRSSTATYSLIRHSLLLPDPRGQDRVLGARWSESGRGLEHRPHHLYDHGCGSVQIMAGLHLLCGKKLGSAARTRAIAKRPCPTSAPSITWCSIHTQDRLVVAAKYSTCALFTAGGDVWEARSSAGIATAGTRI